MDKELKKTKEKIKKKPANRRNFKEKTLLKKIDAEEKGVKLEPKTHDYAIKFEKNKGGRPSALEDAAPRILESLRNGNTYECACGVSRISYNTFNGWMRKAKEELEQGLDTKYTRFFCDVQEAERACEEEVLALWKKEMPSNWQACKEYLSRRHHKDWGAKDRVDVTSNGETVGKTFYLPMKDEEE